MAIDYTTPAGQVRLLIGDRTEPYLFSDEELDGYLAISGGSVKRAAASALLTIAGNEAYLYKYVRTDDLLVDGPKVAAELRLQAQALKDEAAVAEEEDYEHFQVAYPLEGCEYEYMERPQVKPWSYPCPW